MAKKGEQAWFDKDDPTKPNKNAIYLKINMEIISWPDIDIWDPEQLRERINKYFQLNIDYNVKPTVKGLAMAIGLPNRQILYSIATDQYFDLRGKWTKLPHESRVLIRKAYDSLENMWEYRFDNGQINPASGIFLAKNHFGYKDVIEQQVQQQVEEVHYSIDDIRSKYLPTSDSHALPDPMTDSTFDSEQVSTFDSASDSD